MVSISGITHPGLLSIDFAFRWNGERLFLQGTIARLGEELLFLVAAEEEFLGVAWGGFAGC